jgi:hypothetical protein
MGKWGADDGDADYGPFQGTSSVSDHQWSKAAKKLVFERTSGGGSIQQVRQQAREEVQGDQAKPPQKTPIQKNGAWRNLGVLQHILSHHPQREPPKSESHSNISSSHSMPTLDLSGNLNHVCAPKLNSAHSTESVVATASQLALKGSELLTSMQQADDRMTELLDQVDAVLSQDKASDKKEDPSLRLRLRLLRAERGS